jgi:hypothetical protein
MSLASLILMTNAVGRNAVSVFARVQSLCVLFMTGVVIMCAALEDFPTSCTDPRHAQLNKQQQQHFNM